MKKALALISLTALLVGCGNIDPVPAPQPQLLSDQTLDLGGRISATLEQPFEGSWRISGVPDWLEVSQTTGQGALKLLVTAHRAEATPAEANLAQLSGSFKVVWTPSGTANSSAAVITVTATQYQLSGRVVAASSVTGQAVTGQDVQPGTFKAPPSGPGVPAAHGIIVQYRDSALRNAVLRNAVLGGPLEAQATQAQDAAASAARQRSRAILIALGVQPADGQPLGERAALLALPATAEHLAALRADPNVVSAVPNAVLHEQSLAQPVIPTDQYAPLQWAFPLLGYPAVWRDMEAGGYTRPVTVAVVDSGVRYDHPDLAGKLYGPEDGALDLVTGVARGDGDDVDSDPTDPSGPGKTGSHGTHVSGIIVANWGTNKMPACAACSPTGVVGASYLAPVKVLPIRVIDTQGNTDAATVANGLLYAAGVPITVAGKTYTNPHPAQVINLSLGGDEVSAAEAQVMCEAVTQAQARGALVVVAAGNSGTTALYYPAACPGAVAVASVTLSGTSTPIKADYSNAYAQVQLSAPGGVGRIPSYFNGGRLNGASFPDRIISTGWDYTKNEPNYEIEAGTSQAAPQVAALAALLLSKGVTKSADDTLARMVATATDLGAAGRDPQFGYGLINAAAALGAPAISSTLGLRLQDALGHSYQPALDSLGRFTAYLGDGTYRVVGGLDTNGNGILGEAGEPQAERQATLGPDAPTVDVGDLLVR